MRRAQLLSTAVPLIALGSLLAAIRGPAAAVMTAVALAASCAAMYRFLMARYRAWGYLEREDDLLVRRGCMVRRLSVVPYGRMQFIDVTAGPFERRFGLATVRMHTAAAASDARIPGLDAVEAARLRDQLARLGEARAAGL